MSKICQQCQTPFTISDSDQTFYVMMKVPEPTLCYFCRMIRRLSFRNESGEIVATYSELGTFWNKTTARRLWERVQKDLESERRERDCAQTKHVAAIIGESQQKQKESSEKQAKQIVTALSE